jgi:DNA polymerase bacteriophage-type
MLPTLQPERCASLMPSMKASPRYGCRAKQSRQNFFEAERNSEWLVAAHNDAFESAIEREVFAPRYEWPLVPIERHRCTMAMACAASLPASLEAVADVLELANRKDKAGAEIMKVTAVPRAPRDGEDPGGLYWQDDPELLEQLYAYCKQDVEVERELYHRLPPLIPQEQAQWELNAKINDRGICIDRPLLEASLRIAAAAEREINASIIILTEGDVHTIGQTDRLIEWLGAHGCEVKDLKKGTLKHALRRKDLVFDARQVIEARLGGAHAAARKLETLHAWLGDDNE